MARLLFSDEDSSPASDKIKDFAYKTYDRMSQEVSLGNNAPMFSKKFHVEYSFEGNQVAYEVMVKIDGLEGDDKIFIVKTKDTGGTPPTPTVDCGTDLNDGCCLPPLTIDFNLSDPEHPVTQGNMLIELDGSGMPSSISQSPETGFSIDPYGGGDINPGLAGAFGDIPDVTWTFPSSISAKSWKVDQNIGSDVKHCIEWAIATSDRGMNGNVGSYMKAGHSDNTTNEPYNKISWAYDFTQLMSVNASHSCPWDDAPGCGDTYAVEDVIVEGDTSIFNCASGASLNQREYFVSAAIVGTHYAYTDSNFTCNPCDASRIVIRPDSFTITGAGWAAGVSGNAILVTPPNCDPCNNCENGSLTMSFSQTQQDEYPGTPSSVSVPLAVQGCGGVGAGLTIVGPDEVACGALATYTAVNPDGAAVSVEWSWTGTTGSIGTTSGIFGAASDNTNCDSNGMVVATWTCPSDPTKIATGAMNVKVVCYTYDDKAYITYNCQSQGTCVDFPGIACWGSCSFLIEGGAAAIVQYNCDGVPIGTGYQADSIRQCNDCDITGPTTCSSWGPGWGSDNLTGCKRGCVADDSMCISDGPFVREDISSAATKAKGCCPP